MFPKKLHTKLQQRQETNSLRALGTTSKGVDFSSNDYLGFAKNETIFNQTHQYLVNHNYTQNGATGSRLLSGNHPLYTIAEQQICEFHQAEAALLFNSGYNANLGFFASVPQRGDVILYDEFIHASIRDGMQLSNAKSYKFQHNSITDLEKKLQSHHTKTDCIYVVTESVFSMDGDCPHLTKMATLCKKYNAYLVVDEAHAVGVLGHNGTGLVQQLNLQHQVFARIVTFGKALGCHGAVVLGSEQLKQYLVNFSRAFIYTTGLPPHAIATIKTTYVHLESTSEIEKLQQNIQFFQKQIDFYQLNNLFISSQSAIQSCIIKGNDNVKNIAFKLQEKGFAVKSILSPTVPKGKERLRFCLHSYNTQQQIADVLQLLAKFVKE